MIFLPFFGELKRKFLPTLGEAGLEFLRILLGGFFWQAGLFSGRLTLAQRTPERKRGQSPSTEKPSGPSPETISPPLYEKTPRQANFYQALASHRYA
jgi:hypothetical protein